MGPIWVLSAPDGPHVGPMNLAMRDISLLCKVYPNIHGHYSRVVTGSLEPANSLLFNPHGMGYHENSYQIHVD